MREPLIVFYITAATVHQISRLAFLMFQSSAFDKGIYCTYIFSHSYFILEYFVWFLESYLRILGIFENNLLFEG
jgi:hypothetical protein